MTRSATVKETWADPIVRKKRLEGLRRNALKSGYLQNLSKGQRRRFKDSEERRKHGERLKLVGSRTRFKKGRTPWNKGLTKKEDPRLAAMAKAWADPVTKAKRIEAMKLADNKARFKKGQASWSKGLTKKEDPRIAALAERIRETLLGRTKKTHPYIAIAAEKRSERTRGPNASNWQGGISIEPYGIEWLDQRYKESIKQRDNCKCLNPDCSGESENLGLHHIDYNKKNCEPWNLITLCNSCNPRANSNRDYWTKFYQQLMHDRYGYIYTEAEGF